ncbi:dTDP-4-dehydrorhamnose 3,5-epimerase [candidate division WOR-3 bacterium]|uniref:dTDP-4-dehydrorhamnose 3,5-epimerase n=1 Tax=candidate division WOR-3 bacterium TaxID=2052148 RepID=A0A9D5K9E0_UNCW3|nr:dTDP-4-dehydrorhamnose 3,5-epimerase [candidate division WOR-3 bacterium]MBD3364748.1 dTDP-4-dehydrorhamnose 3,5-epimerase [candidate division WOR-3 bacterium]
MQDKIEGVEIKKLRVIPDERGWLMEILRSDDTFFAKFGQVYLSAVYPGVVKGWHYHKVQQDNLCVVKGMAKLVLYDSRETSSTTGKIMELFIGEKNPVLVSIPTGVLHGMKGVGTEPALFVNVPSEPYDYDKPDEYRVDPHSDEVPYDWSREDG